MESVTTNQGLSQGRSSCLSRRPSKICRCTSAHAGGNTRAAKELGTFERLLHTKDRLFGRARPRYMAEHFSFRVARKPQACGAHFSLFFLQKLPRGYGGTTPQILGQSSLFGRNPTGRGILGRGHRNLFDGCSSKALACHLDEKRALNDAADAPCWGLSCAGFSSQEGLLWETDPPFELSFRALGTNILTLAVLHSNSRTGELEQPEPGCCFGNFHRATGRCSAPVSCGLFQVIQQPGHGAPRCSAWTPQGPPSAAAHASEFCATCLHVRVVPIVPCPI